MNDLKEDHFDIAMSGLEGTVQRASMTILSDSYMDVTLAVMVPDYELIAEIMFMSDGKYY